MQMPEYSLIQEQVTTLCLDLLLKAQALSLLPARGVVHCAGSSITASVSGMIDRRMVLKG